MDDIFSLLMALTDDPQAVSFALQMAEQPDGEMDFAMLQNFLHIASTKENDDE